MLLVRFEGYVNGGPDQKYEMAGFGSLYEQSRLLGFLLLLWYIASLFWLKRTPFTGIEA